MTVRTRFQIPIVGSSSGAATVDVAIFDFATAGQGVSNLDNAEATFESFIMITTGNTFGMFMRTDALAKRISGTVSVIAVNDTYGVGDVVVRAGDSAITSFWGSTAYIVSGTQVRLRIIMNSGAGSLLYGGLMRGFTES